MSKDIESVSKEIILCTKTGNPADEFTRLSCLRGHSPVNVAKFSSFHMTFVT